MEHQPHLTPKMAECLSAVKTRIEQTGFSPTVRELQGDLGYKSMSRIVGLLESLEERGAIVRIPNRARSIRIIKENEINLNCPVLRKRLIAAGWTPPPEKNQKF